MTAVWESFLDESKDPAARDLKQEINELLDTCGSDGDDFIKSQGMLLKKYLNQFADGTLDAAEFKDEILDLKTGIDINKIKLEVEAMARAQALIEKIDSMLLDRLLKLI